MRTRNGTTAGAERTLIAASLLLGLALLITACVGLIPGLPADAVGVEATVSSTSITLAVQNIPNGGLAAIALDNSGLTFDPSAIQVTGVSPASGWTVLAQRIDNSSGEVRIAMVRTSGGTGDGPIATLSFRAQPSQFDPSSARVQMDADRITAGDANNDPIPASQLETGIRD